MRKSWLDVDRCSRDVRLVFAMNTSFSYSAVQSQTGLQTLPELRTLETGSMISGFARWLNRAPNRPH
ncbi:hypothetical protein [Pseudomonas chlororaphis]|uniref:hypothetical protein n=1 Tax=Pseudomonas chlororaphis TaxID=587753 RepID=UPI0016805CC0|nr:hypothetical protein [Pseudomonas chlororaphis]